MHKLNFYLHLHELNYLPVTRQRAHKQANADISISMACRLWEKSKMLVNQSPNIW